MINLKQNLGIIALLWGGMALTFAQSTAFTYQGRLTDGGSPASGRYDLRFTIFDSTNTPGAVVAGPLTNAATSVSNGLFTVALDFGSGVFTGAERWLEMGVRSNGTGAAFATLPGRQPLTAAPYALHAGSVDGTNITGMVPNNRLPANLVRSDMPQVEWNNAVVFHGPVEFDHVSGPPFAVVSSPDMVIGLNAQMLGNRTAQGFWQTGGNAGTTPGTDFLGTTDNQPLEVRINNLTAMRLQYATNSGSTTNQTFFTNQASVNVRLGYWDNRIGARVVGATITGGGGRGMHAGTTFHRPNEIDADFASIGGGWGNSISTNGFSGTIAGGSDNQVLNSYSTVGGGADNVAGEANESLAGIGFSTVAGGYQNHATGLLSSVGGGGSCLASGPGAVVAGGGVDGTSPNYFAMTMNEASGMGATVPGGAGNTAKGDFSYAAGRYARALHDHAFVWTDGTLFETIRSNEFAIRATGGLRLFSNRGISLNAAPAPIITRAYDVFDATVPEKEGHGRWGLFMESSTLVLGIPNIANRQFQVAKYNADGSREELMHMDQAGNMSISGAYSPSSDRNAKENFTGVNPAEVLEKVAALPVSRWNFKQDPEAEHIGPMAQDFHAAFGLGTDDKHIATVDADGVALAAIQGLNQKVEAQRAENAELKQEVAELRRLVNQLSAKLTGGAE